MREPLNVLEARLELGPQLQRPLGAVLGAGALGDLGRVAIRAMHEANGLHRVRRGVLAHEVPPGRDKANIPACD